MHDWGDEDFDWLGLNEGIIYLETFMTRWGRINVSQAKEKFGTARIYCSLGTEGLYWLIFPRRVFYRWGPRWKWTAYGFMPFWRTVNRVLVPWQVFIYRTAYRRTVARWPHLEAELTCCADYPELLR